MDPLTIARFALKYFASSAVSTVVTNIVTHTTPEGLNAQKRVMTVVGGFILSSIAGAAAADYIDDVVSNMLPEKKSEQKLEKKSAEVSKGE
jgi:hypothetical protein